ncbi:MAG: hypothetical protein WDO16_23460 [Bacteroidota bacterium]
MFKVNNVVSTSSIGKRRQEQAVVDDISRQILFPGSGNEQITIALMT